MANNSNSALLAVATPSAGSKLTSKAEATINVALKKFLVNFRRPSDYKGEYGFDWLRDEYINPIFPVPEQFRNKEFVENPQPLCRNIYNGENRTANIDALKQLYRNNIKSGADELEYYESWLSIFPHTTTEQFKHGSTIHKNGVDLDIEVEEINNIALTKDDTNLIFEPDSPYLIVTPNELKLSDFIDSGLNGAHLGENNFKNYYRREKIINVKCEGGVLKEHTLIKVFAQLGTQKKEVGKLIVHRNNVIPKAQIVVVNVITDDTPCNVPEDYQYILKRQSFNQALIRAEVTVDTKFDINSLPENTDVENFKEYITGDLQITTEKEALDFLKALIKLYERYGTHVPKGEGRFSQALEKLSGWFRIGNVDSDLNKKTYLFFTKIKADTLAGISDADKPTPTKWGNAYVVFGKGLTNNYTIVHECGHTLSLMHIFSDKLSPYVFHKGLTDNYMDYDFKKNDADNPYKGRMCSFFKWQWEIMRNDRSLITDY